MTHYRSNLRDIEFNFFEVLGAADRLGEGGPFAEVDGDTAHDILAEVERLATGPVAAFYTGKVAVARFFATTVLPELAARRSVVENTDNALMDVADSAF